MKSHSDVKCSLTRTQAWSLYALHALAASTGRTYDFASIVFTASLFPKSLTAASIRGISTTVACVVFSTTLGTWIDRSASRLRTLTTSIWAQQGATIFAYMLWALILRDHVGNDIKQLQDTPRADGWSTSIFALIVLTGIIVKLGSVSNDLVVDREWLPVLVPSSMSKEGVGADYDLTHLNAMLRRIDLVCKILMPFFFNFVIWFTNSEKRTVLMLLFLSAGSCFVEIKLAKGVYASNQPLREPKEGAQTASVLRRQWGPRAVALRCVSAIFQQVDSLRLYFSTIVWIPSISWTLLHFTVLAYSASLITYLLEVGYSLPHITFAQSTGSAMEIAATFVTPWLIHRISQRKRGPPASSTVDAEEDESFTAGSGAGADSSTLETVGLWGISWQFSCLVPVVVALFVATGLLGKPNDAQSTITPASLSLLAFLSISRAGYWTYELTTQELTQSLVPVDQLSAFAGTQQSFHSFFELSHWVATAIWSTPEKFPYLALASLMAIGTALSAYTYWYLKRRSLRRYELVMTAHDIELDETYDESDEGDDDDGQHVAI